MTTFWEWLRSESAVGWIAWLTTVIAGVGGWYLKRKRPQHILVNEAYSYPLARIAPRGAAVSRLKTTFDDQVVNEPVQLILEVTNEGDTPIRNVDLRLTFNSTPILEKDLIDAPDGASLWSEDPNVLSLKMPYLNPRREHRQTVRVIVVLDGKYSVGVVGGGEGWSARYQSRAQRTRPAHSAKLLVLPILFVLGFQYWISTFGGRESSSRLEAFSLIAVVMLLAVGVSAYVERTARDRN